MIRTLTAAFACCLTALPAFGQQVPKADYQVFSDETAFLAAVGAVTKESFEAFPTEECSGGGGAQATSVATDGFVVTTTPAALGGTSFVCVGNAVGGSPGPTDGNNALVAGSNTGDRWSLQFDMFGKKPVSAVAFYLTDAAERGDALFVLPDGREIVIAQCCRTGYTPLFFGIVVKKGLKSFQLKNTGTADGWGIDELMFGYRGR